MFLFQQALINLLQLIRADLERERRGKVGVENLARALKQTPTFASEDSQQNVHDKLHHVSLIIVLKLLELMHVFSLSITDFLFTR